LTAVAGNLFGEGPGGDVGDFQRRRRKIPHRPPRRVPAATGDQHPGV